VRLSSALGEVRLSSALGEVLSASSRSLSPATRSRPPLALTCLSLALACRSLPSSSSRSSNPPPPAAVGGNAPSNLHNFRKQIEGDAEYPHPIVTFLNESGRLFTGASSAAVDRTFDVTTVSSGTIVQSFAEITHDDDLRVKYEQIMYSQHDPEAKWSNLLDAPWERPRIKNVVVAYGVDVPTEIGYVYAPRKGKGIPKLEEIVSWREAWRRARQLRERIVGERGCWRVRHAPCAPPIAYTIPLRRCVAP